MISAGLVVELAVPRRERHWRDTGRAGLQLLYYYESRRQDMDADLGVGEPANQQLMDPAADEVPQPKRWEDEGKLLRLVGLSAEDPGRCGEID